MWGVDIICVAESWRVALPGCFSAVLVAEAGTSPPQTLKLRSAGRPARPFLRQTAAVSLVTVFCPFC